LDFEADPINKIKTLIIKTYKNSFVRFQNKFLYITRLKDCQKLDFEAGPINRIKPLIMKTCFFPISKSIQFPFITRLKICQKLDFEAGPIKKSKTLIKTYSFDFKMNEASFFNPIQTKPNIIKN
jgi:hypothetical protein